MRFKDTLLSYCETSQHKGWTPQVSVRFLLLWHSTMMKAARVGLNVLITVHHEGKSWQESWGCNWSRALGRCWLTLFVEKIEDVSCSGLETGYLSDPNLALEAWGDSWGAAGLQPVWESQVSWFEYQPTHNDSVMGWMSGKYGGRNSQVSFHVLSSNPGKFTGVPAA